MCKSPSLLAASVLCFLALQGCLETAVRVDCGKTGLMRTGFGVINTADYGLGTVVELDPFSHRAVPFYALSVADDDVIQSKSDNDLATVSSPDFTLSSKPPLPAELATSLGDEVRTNTMMQLSGVVFRQEIGNVSTVINRDKAFAALLQTKMQKNPGRSFIVVSSVTTAGKGEFTLRNRTRNSEGFTMVERGYQKMLLSFSCRDEIEKIRARGPLFFRFASLSYDPRAEIIEVEGPQEDLGQFTLSPVAAP